MESFLIDLSPIFEVVVQLLGVALLTLGTWAVKRFADKLGLEKESKIRYLVDEVVYNAVNFGLQKLAEQGEKFTPETERKVVADAANYVIRSAPEALGFFGIDEERIRQIIESRLYHHEYEG